MPVLVTALTSWTSAQPRPRARDLGIPFDGATGPLNAITDVAGIEVGHTTLISGEGTLKVGQGPVRTGVTAVLPRGKRGSEPVFAGWFSLNGNGEMTGTTWVEESGFLEGPVLITNTHSVGTVRDAVIAWQLKHGTPGQAWSLPVVAETYDGFLNDINGFHVKDAHVFRALDSSQSGRVVEGNVGGGTGMVCYGFKGGIGTASRTLDGQAGGYTVGVLVQANFGRRPQLRIAGVPVGAEIAEDTPFASQLVDAPPGRAEALPHRRLNSDVPHQRLNSDVAPLQVEGRRLTSDVAATADGEFGSIIIVVATDAPLLPHQLKRLARRAGLGIARTGGVATNGSGDIFIAFSTANVEAARNEVSRQPSASVAAGVVPNGRMSPLFEATVQATEEAIVNALVAAETMTGVDNHKVTALPHDRLKDVMRKYTRRSGP